MNRLPLSPMTHDGLLSASRTARDPWVAYAYAAAATDRVLAEIGGAR